MPDSILNPAARHPIPEHHSEEDGRRRSTRHLPAANRLSTPQAIFLAVVIAREREKRRPDDRNRHANIPTDPKMGMT
jgi:hypothetical protein